MGAAIVLVMIDGLDPEYLEACPAPNLAAIGRQGFRGTGRAMLPTVTNVNNVSLVTGAYPAKHGITSNYWLDRTPESPPFAKGGLGGLSPTPQPTPSFPRKRESTPHPSDTPGNTGVLDSGLRRNDGGGDTPGNTGVLDSGRRRNDGGGDTPGNTGALDSGLRRNDGGGATPESAGVLDSGLRRNDGGGADAGLGGFTPSAATPGGAGGVAASAAPEGFGGAVERYMESGEFVAAETVFQRAAAVGARSLLVTAKDKLRRLLGGGATLSLSAEQPPAWVVAGVGEPPPIYSLEVNRWVLDAGCYIMAQQSFDLVYLTTTDYAMHTYAPAHPESARHIALLDEGLGAVAALAAGGRLLITADHGMSAKSRLLHLPARLARYGVEALAVPIIKDRYTVHHSNLGGCIYVHLRRPAQLAQALDILRHTDGVEAALPRDEAAQRYALMPERMGDIMVLGAREVVFGDPAEVSLPPGLRSHGSAYEAEVPVFGSGPGLTAHSAPQFRENRQLGAYVMDEVLGRP